MQARVMVESLPSSALRSFETSDPCCPRGSLLPQLGVWGGGLLGGHGVTCPASVTHSNMIVVGLRALPTSQNLQLACAIMLIVSVPLMTGTFGD